MTLIAEHQSAVIQHLLDEVANLRDRVTFLESGLAQITESSALEVIELREISREQAKAEITELFAVGETLYYSDICDRLCLDLDLVVEICRELEAEGAIGIDDDVV